VRLLIPVTFAIVPSLRRFGGKKSGLKVVFSLLCAEIEKIPGNRQKSLKIRFTGEAQTQILGLRLPSLTADTGEKYVDSLPGRINHYQKTRRGAKRRGGFLIIGWEPEDQKNDPAYKNHASCCVLMISSFEPTFSTATHLRVRVSDLSGGSTVVFNGGWPGHSCVWCIPGGLVWWRAVKRLKRDSNFVESPQRTVRTQNAIIVTGIDKRTHVKIDPKQP